MSLTGVEGNIKESPTSSALADAGSDLCLACGLCCDGSWFDRAFLRHDEADMARSAGLELIDHDCEGTIAFQLPCLQHRGGRCQIYLERPAVCAQYQCRLLRRHVRGELAPEEAGRVIGEIKKLIDVIRAHNTSQQSALETLRQVFRSGKLPEINSDLRLSMIGVALLAIYWRHFGEKSDTDDPVEKVSLEKS